MRIGGEMELKEVAVFIPFAGWGPFFAGLFFLYGMTAYMWRCPPSAEQVGPKILCN